MSDYLNIGFGENRESCKASCGGKAVSRLTLCNSSLGFNEKNDSKWIKVFDLKSYSYDQF